jgi:hypothetical protein
MPILAIILLSEGGELHSLVYQYSLPILPFLILAVIDSMAKRQEFLQRQRQLGRIWSYLAVVCSLVGFMWLADYQKIPFYGNEVFAGQSTRAAIAHLPPEAKVLADRYTTPHVCHRSEIWAVNRKSLDADLALSNYVLIDLAHAIGRDAEYVKALIPRMQNDPAFQINYHQGQTYLFRRIT